MKKLLACVLAVVIVLSLCVACGAKETKENDSTQPDTTAPADDAQTDKPDSTPSTDDTQTEPSQDSTLLSTPVKVLDTDEFSITFDYRTADGYTLGGTISVINNASPALLYYASDLGEQYVYELADDGTITLYTRESNSDSFVVDTAASQEELKEKTNALLELLSYGGWSFTDRNPTISYRPIEIPNTLDALLYGDEDYSWYELVDDGVVVGQVAVENNTGAFWYLMTNTVKLMVAGVDVEYIYIPEYK